MRQEGHLYLDTAFSHTLQFFLGGVADSLGEGPFFGFPIPIRPKQMTLYLFYIDSPDSGSGSGSWWQGKPGGE